MTYTWNLDPVAFSLFGLDVRWYGLVYVLGFFLTLWWGKKLAFKSGMTIDQEAWENLLFGAFFAGIVGGRFGHFLFWDPIIFFTDFWEIFKVYHGGMSIHGGILGAVGFMLWWTRKHQVSVLKVFDVLVLPLAVVLAFGRLTNFINGELWGIPTDQSWGVVFPYVDELLRHPSQLYEVFKNVIIAGFLAYGWGKSWSFRPGLLATTFILSYGVLRFIIEFWKDDLVVFWLLSPGQILCVGMILIAFFIAKSQNFWKMK